MAAAGHSRTNQVAYTICLAAVIVALSVAGALAFRTVDPTRRPPPAPNVPAPQPYPTPTTSPPIRFD